MPRHYSTGAVPVMRKPKPTLNLTGKEAKKFFGRKPGFPVTAIVRGRIVQTGIDRYTPGSPANATLEIDSTQVGGEER